MRRWQRKALIAVLQGLLAHGWAGVPSTFAQILPPMSLSAPSPNTGLVPMVFRIDLESGWNDTKALGLSRAGTIRELSLRVQRQAATLLLLLREGEIQGLVANPRVIWIAGVVTADVSPGFLPRLLGVSGLREIRRDTPLVMEVENEKTSGKVFTSTHTETLQRMEVPEVWAQGFSGKNILIASIDSGVFSTHSDLAGQIWANPGEVANDLLDNDGNGFVDDLHGWNYLGNNKDTSDGNGHGTLVAGLAVGDGTAGTETGAAPDARLMILRLGSTESTLWAASQYAVEMGARIIMQAASFKWSTVPRPDYPTWRTVTENELAAGVIRINSSGNTGELTGDNPIPYNVNVPANCPPPWLHPAQTLQGGLSSALAVANVDLGSDTIISTSAQGPSEWADIQTEVDPNYPYGMPPEFRDYPYAHGISQGLLKPDLAAYGQGSISTAAGGGYSSFMGTSAATGHLAGITALLLEARPEATPAMLAEALFRGATDKGPAGWDTRYGEGLVNAQNSLALILQPCLGQGEDMDLDGVCGAVDNCPHSSNPGQTNQDADSLGDACDNCLHVDNAGQEDSDTDGLGDACDCAPENGDIKAPPWEMSSSVAFESDGVTLTWAPLPEAQTYDVFKGRIRPGITFNYNHTCHRLNLPFPTVVDLGHPPAGQVFFYLVRSVNCFGEGSLGASSGGTPRPGPGDCSDLDSDQVSDSLDNCPVDFNPGQEDQDGDSTGDLCDPDQNGDGMEDPAGKCPLAGTPEHKDVDQDSTGETGQSERIRQIAVVSWPQAMGVGLVGTPIEKAGQGCKEELQAGSSGFAPSPKN